MTKNLISTVLVEADVRENGEGLDNRILIEALQVPETQFSEAVSGADLLAAMAAEGSL